MKIQRRLLLVETEREGGRAELEVEQRGPVTYGQAKRMLKLALFQLERQEKEVEARKLILGKTVNLPHEYRPRLEEAGL